MNWAFDAGLAALALAVCGSAIFCVVSAPLLRAWAAERSRREGHGEQHPPLPPITFLRPLKSGVPELRATLGALAGALFPGDQMLLGVAPGSAEEAIADAVRTAFPVRDIAVIRCEPGAALNPKISKLLQMTPHARHTDWMVMDSEICGDAEFLTALRSEWTQTGADVLTCPYRFSGLRTWPQRLDAAGTLLTFWPGLAIMRRFGAVRLTLGACTALRRRDVEAVGGWRAFGDDLAEDNRLGAALARAGCTVRLSAHPATLASDPLSWGDYWRHQRRVAVTYRVCDPAGFGGSIGTHGVTAGALLLLWAVVFGMRVPVDAAASVFALTLAQRWWLARQAARMLDWKPSHLPVAILLASFVESACWVLAWFSPQVWWSGRKWRVTRKGKLLPLEVRSSAG